MQLGPEEQAQASRFRFAKDRLAFAVGRLLVQRYLANSGPAPPGGWRLKRNPHGKPFVEPVPGYIVPAFNISHTAGAVIAAFATGRAIGVDVEQVDAEISVAELGRSYFAAAEAELLQSLSGSMQRDAFFKLWTLKEAYLKALGTGLSVGLSDFSLRLYPPAVLFPAAIDDRPDLWFFAQEQLSPAHYFALAARRLPNEELSYRRLELRLEQLLRPGFLLGHPVPPL